MLIISIAVFFLIFSFVILIHELGHFSAARRHGVHVEEFGLGVPPKALTLFKDKKKCEYTLNWIPFGGFVRLEGEDDLDLKSKNKKTSFAAQGILPRMEIILAGVFMNFVSAVIILTALFTIGTEPILLNKEAVMDNIEKGVIVLDEGIPVLEVADGPAKEAGLRKGDIVYLVNGETVQGAAEISAKQKANTEVVYSVKRTNENEKTEEFDLKILANDEAKVGVAFSILPAFKEVKKVSYSVPYAFVYSLEVSYDIAKATVSAFKNIVLRLLSLKGVPEGVAGPVGIAAMTHTIVESGDIAAMFKFVALLSLSLAIMNVLPIPALDGGRFLFILFEAITRKPINAKWEVRIHSISYILLLLLILVVTGNDIYKLIMQAL